MNAIAAWLLTLGVHAAALLLFARTIDRLLPTLRPSWRELMWRSALFGALATASAQSLAPLPAVGLRWHWTAAAPVAVRLGAPASGELRGAVHGRGSERVAIVNVAALPASAATPRGGTPGRPRRRDAGGQDAASESRRNARRVVAGRRRDRIDAARARLERTAAPARCGDAGRDRQCA